MLCGFAVLCELCANVSLFLERSPFAQSSQRTAKLAASRWFLRRAARTGSISSLTKCRSLPLKMLEDIWIQLCRIVNTKHLYLLNKFAVLFHLPANWNERILHDRAAERSIVIINPVPGRRLSFTQL